MQWHLIWQVDAGQGMFIYGGLVVAMLNMDTAERVAIERWGQIFDSPRKDDDSQIISNMISGRCT